MPIKTIKTDLEWGDVFYLKTDHNQEEYTLVGIIMLPSNQLQFILSCVGIHVTVYDFECSKDRDELKVLKSREGDDTE